MTGAEIRVSVAPGERRTARDGLFDAWQRFAGSSLVSVLVVSPLVYFLPVGVAIKRAALFVVTGSRRKLQDVAVALVFAGVVANVVKLLVLRERPMRGDELSWPSGHTAAIAAFASAISGWRPAFTRWCWPPTDTCAVAAPVGPFQASSESTTDSGAPTALATSCATEQPKKWAIHQPSPVTAECVVCVSRQH